MYNRYTQEAEASSEASSSTCKMNAGERAEKAGGDKEKKIGVADREKIRIFADKNSRNKKQRTYTTSWQIKKMHSKR